MKDINNLINNQTLLVEDQEKDEPVTPCMDVYKYKIQSYGSLRDINQSHLSVNRREASYKIRDRIRQRQSEWKGAGI